jgi:hypothetical protein
VGRFATGARPDVAKELGFIGGTVPLQHGPAEGEEGLRKNVATLEGMRNRIGTGGATVNAGASKLSILTGRFD